MPYSHPFHKDFVANHIRSVLTESDRVLDVGCGCGTYALLLPEIKMDGIEIHEPYVSRFGLQDLYQTMHIGDIREFDFSAYTYLIMGDVFEHLTFNEARSLLTRMEGKRIMIAVPYLYKQGEWEGNIYETHWQPDLTPEVMALRYPELKLLVGDAVYGYYVNY